MKKKWWHSSVVYQIYPRSFNDTNGDGVGDIRGIIDKLDYLGNLGIDLIWISPLYKSPMEDNGYDISDYCDIDPLFGNMQDMEELITEAKKRNIRILMDLVINHTSSEHKWFQESKQSRDNKYREYYIWRDSPNDLKSLFGGSAWEYDQHTEQYYMHLFATHQPDLNWENEEIHQEIYDLINFWLEKGIAGFRMDVIDLIGKEIDKGITSNGPRLHELIRNINRNTFGNYDSFTVGETWGATPEIAKMYSDPKREELSTIFQFEHIQLDWKKGNKWEWTELDLIELKDVLSKWQTCFNDDGWNSLFWNNHDLPRIVSRWGNDKEYRVKSAMMFAILLHFMQGIPYIYQGEEIGMTNIKYDSLDDYNDVEIHGNYKEYVIDQGKLTHDEFMRGVYKMGRDNARTPMQWDDSENAGFTDGTPWLKINSNYKTINVKNDLVSDDSIFKTYKSLIDIRKNSELSNLILYGNYELLERENKNVFIYRRYDDDSELLVVCNFYEKEVTLSVDLKFTEVIISNYDIDGSADLSNYVLKPYEAFAVRISKKAIE